MGLSWTIYVDTQQRQILYVVESQVSDAQVLRGIER